MNKRKVFVAALALCIAAIMACGSLAYFTFSKTAENEFMVAGYDPDNPDNPPSGDDIFSVDVIETLPEPDEDDTWTAEPADPDEEEEDEVHGIIYKNIQPGDVIPKDPTVVNTGKYNMYVRVKVTLTKAKEWRDIAEANGITKLEPSDDNEGVIGGFDDEKWVRACDPEYDEDANTLVYTYYLGSKGEDGVVGTELAPDGTAKLFDTVTIPSSLTADQFATVADFKISVSADAIQTANMDGIEAAFEIFDGLSAEEEPEEEEEEEEEIPEEIVEEIPETEELPESN